ncbi:MAG: RluA family pseudouridine synthase [Pelagibacteraceae bacterium]|jgi:23S rRNA pseudouridine1911/1915/1917 synthase
MSSSYIYHGFEISILYEDHDIAILNKPSGLITHKKNIHDTEISLQESLSQNFEINDDEPGKEGIVHRLDKDTSGLIIITKNKTIKGVFQELFKKRLITKHYQALSYGILNQSYIEVSKNITRQKYQRTKFKTSQTEGKEALTKITNLQTYHGSISLLDCEIITGRTHQIRVHLTSLGLPIVGDKNYILDKEQKFRLNNLKKEIVDELNTFPRQALHSYHVEFEHPISKKLIKITCDLPDDMKDLQAKLL